MHSVPKAQSSTSEAGQIVIVGMNGVVVVVELAGVSSSRVGAGLTGLDVGEKVSFTAVGPAVVGACDGGGVTKMRTKIAP